MAGKGVGRRSSSANLKAGPLGFARDDKAKGEAGLMRSIFKRHTISFAVLLVGVGCLSYALTMYVVCTAGIGSAKLTAEYMEQVAPETYQWPMVAFGTAFMLNLLTLIFERDSSKFQLALVACYINILAWMNDFLSWKGVLPILQDPRGGGLHIGRLLMWLHTTPSMVYLLSMLSDYPHKKVVTIMVVDAVMLAAAIWGHITHSTALWLALFACAFTCFTYVVQHLWAMFSLTVADAVNDSYRSSLVTLRLCTVGLWFAFPVVWLVVRTGTLSIGAEEWLWTIGDFFGKVMFSSSLLQGNFLTLEQRRLIALRAVEEGNRIQVIQELRELVEQKERFMSGMSHELRTPLNGIIGLSEALVMGSCGPINEAASKTISTIKTSGARLLNLINDILDAAAMRQMKGQLTIKHERVELSRIAQDVIDLCQPLAKRGVKLVHSLPSDLPPVLGDTGRLIQILHNLIGNSCKFTHAGTISITAQHKLDEVEVAVNDTGIGIPEDKFASIFQAFEQVDMSVTRKYGGTGLGLNLVKQLVEAHGGAIKVHSKLGVGTTFHFTLKVWDEKRAPKAPVAQEDGEEDEENDDLGRKPSVTTGAATAGTASIERAVVPPKRCVGLSKGGVTGRGSGGAPGGLQSMKSRPQKAISCAVEEPPAPTSMPVTPFGPPTPRMALAGGAVSATTSENGSTGSAVAAAAGEIDFLLDPRRSYDATMVSGPLPLGEAMMLARSVRKRNSSNFVTEAASRLSRAAGNGSHPAGRAAPDASPAAGAAAAGAAAAAAAGAATGVSGAAAGGAAGTAVAVAAGAGAGAGAGTTSRRVSEVVSEVAWEAGHGKIHVLSVDDDPVNQMVIQNLLGVDKYEITQAMDGEEALNILKSLDELPDIILLDVMMPGISGYEVCRRMRELFPLSCVPIIMISAKDQEENIVEGLQCGSNDYVVKPFGRAEMLARISAHLRFRDDVYMAGEIAAIEGDMTGRVASCLAPLVSVPAWGTSLPQGVAAALESGSGSTVQMYPQVTALAVRLTNLRELCGSCSRDDVTAALTSLYVALDEALKANGGYCVDDVAQDHITIITGLKGEADQGVRALNIARALLAATATGLNLPSGFALSLAAALHTLPAQGVVVGTTHPVMQLTGQLPADSLHLLAIAPSGNVLVSSQAAASLRLNAAKADTAAASPTNPTNPTNPAAGITSSSSLKREGSLRSEKSEKNVTFSSGTAKNSDVMSELRVASSWRGEPTYLLEVPGVEEHARLVAKKLSRFAHLVAGPSALVTTALRLSPLQRAMMDLVRAAPLHLIELGVPATTVGAAATQAAPAGPPAAGPAAPASPSVLTRSLESFSGNFEAAVEAIRASATTLVDPQMAAATALAANPATDATSLDAKPSAPTLAPRSSDAAGVEDPTRVAKERDLLQRQLVEVSAEAERLADEVDATRAELTATNSKLDTARAALAVAEAAAEAAAAADAGGRAAASPALTTPRPSVAVSVDIPPPGATTLVVNAASAEQLATLQDQVGALEQEALQWRSEAMAAQASLVHAERRVAALQDALVRAYESSQPTRRHNVAGSAVLGEAPYRLPAGSGFAGMAGFAGHSGISRGSITGMADITSLNGSMVGGVDAPPPVSGGFAAGNVPGGFATWASTAATSRSSMMLSSSPAAGGGGAAFMAAGLPMMGPFMLQQGQGSRRASNGFGAPASPAVSAASAPPLHARGSIPLHHLGSPLAAQQRQRRSTVTGPGSSVPLPHEGAGLEHQLVLPPEAFVDIRVLLEDLGLADLAPQFLEEQVTPSLLPHLSEAALTELGVSTLGARLKLKMACRAIQRAQM